MKYVAYVVVLYMLLSYSAQVGEGLSTWLQKISDFGSAVKRAHRRSKRSLFEFEDVITCLQPWVDVLTTYADYGCYCGFRGAGQPLDDTDKCCYYHDKCYTDAEAAATSFSEKAYGSYFSTYEFKCVNNSQIVCDKEFNTPYVNGFCECDRLAAECFLQTRRSYNKKLFNIKTSKYCTESPDLSDLNIGTHTLGKLYSCELKQHDDRCCLDTGYNSEYEICCNGVVRKRLSKEMKCEEHSDL